MKYFLKEEYYDNVSFWQKILVPISEIYFNNVNENTQQFAIDSITHYFYHLKSDYETGRTFFGSRIKQKTPFEIEIFTMDGSFAEECPVMVDRFNMFGEFISRTSMKFDTFVEKYKYYEDN